jgi:hypothetical protein
MVLSPYVQTAIDGVMTNLRSAQPGNRNDMFFKAAVRLYEFVEAGALPAIEADSLLESEGSSLGLISREIKDTLKSAYKKASGHPASIPQATNKPSSTQQSYTNLEEYAAAHGTPLEPFIKAGWINRVSQRHGQPAVRFTTTTGPRWRFLGGKGRKYDSPPGYQRCWYLLNEAIKIAQATNQPLVLCNGEASAVAAGYHGIAAFTIAGGAEKPSIPKNLVEELKRAWTGQIIVAFDCDQTGRNAALKVMLQLRAAGFTAHAVDLQGGAGFDLADFCKLHQASSVEALAQCPNLSVNPPKAAGGNGSVQNQYQNANSANSPQRTPIDVTHCDLPALVAQAWDALIAINMAETPFLFRQGGQLVRLEKSDDEDLVVCTVDRVRLRGELARACQFHVVRRGQICDVAPPQAVVEDMLVNIDDRLPALRRIVRCPTFAPDGTLQDTPGYHAAGRIYYHPRSDESIPTVADQPSPTDLGRAKAYILDELLGDFSFTSPADKAHAVVLMLAPFVRDMITGPTPLHIIEAPTMGSGKGLLADVLLYPSLGSLPAPAAAANDDDEWRKRITSHLLSAPSVFLIDNLNTALDSGAFCAALTTTVWEDRILGRSEMVRLPVQCIWVLTANNPILSTELLRRSIRIRIDPQIERPWQRKPEDFKHPSLRSWMAENRADLIWACLVLVSYGLQHGTPSKPLGSYEAWSALMCQILNGANVPGFLDNLDAFYAAADTEATVWSDIVDVWRTVHGDAEVKSADIHELIVSGHIDLPLKGKNEQAQRTALGMQLRKMRDRVINGYRIEEAGSLHRAALWKLVKVQAFPSGSTPPPVLQPVASVSGEPVNLCEPFQTPLRTRESEQRQNHQNDQRVEKGSQGSQGSPDNLRTEQAPPQAPDDRRTQSLKAQVEAMHQASRAWAFIDEGRIDLASTIIEQMPDGAIDKPQLEAKINARGQSLSTAQEQNIEQVKICGNCELSRHDTEVALAARQAIKDGSYIVARDYIRFIVNSALKKQIEAEMTDAQAQDI